MDAAIAQLRSRVPALCLAALFNALLLAFLLHSIPKFSAPAVPATQVVFVPLPLLELPRKAVRRPKRAGVGSNAITLPYFNPYTFNPQALMAQRGEQRLSLALATCAPENYDKQSYEIRAACARITTALRYDSGHFGVKTDIADSAYWQMEKRMRNAPYLAPCMTPGGPDVLYLLQCVYDVIMNGYDTRKMQHY